MKRPLGRLAKGSDYYETKIIVSFQTAIMFLYSLFVFIFISIIFHMKQRFNGRCGVEPHAHRVYNTWLQYLSTPNDGRVV